MNLPHRCRVGMKIFNSLGSLHRDLRWWRIRLRPAATAREQHRQHRDTVEHALLRATAALLPPRYLPQMLGHYARLRISARASSSADRFRSVSLLSCIFLPLATANSQLDLPALQIDLSRNKLHPLFPGLPKKLIDFPYGASNNFRFRTAG